MKAPFISGVEKIGEGVVLKTKEDQERITLKL